MIGKKIRAPWMQIMSYGSQELKRFVVLAAVGIVLITGAVGTIAGNGDCPFCPNTEDFLDFPTENPTSIQDTDTPTVETIPILPANYDYENPNLITYIDELKAINSDPDVIIADVRSPEEYADGHIPSAINIPWSLFRGDKGVLIPVENATRILGEKGISPENMVIVYCSSVTGTQCPASYYVFWMLEYFGHGNVSVLDGGFDAWNATYGCTKNVTTRLPTTTYTANLSEERFADTEWVQNNLNNTMVQIVDARTIEEYNVGHIDGTINLNYERLFREGYRLKGADELEYLLSPVGPNGLNRSKDTVVYCKTGAFSSILYLALRMMGYQVRNYDGSWNIWSETLPEATIPISNVSVNPSFAYKGSTVRIYAEVEITSEMKEESKKTSIIQGDREVPYISDSFCADCSGVYVVPTPTTGISFVRAYIHNEDGAKIGTVTMYDYSGNGRYVGEWQTFFAEDGTYYVDIEAIDGEIKTKKKNAAMVEVATDTVGPLISNASVRPLLAHPGSEITIYANISDPSGVKTVRGLIKFNNETVREIFFTDPDSDARYIGKWRWTQSAEIGTYYVDIIATDGKGNEAWVENAVDFVME